MASWSIGTRLAFGAAIVALAYDRPVHSAPPPLEARPESTFSSRDKIRSAAELAERQEDWEAAFSLHCRLLLSDRSSAAREKVSVLLRRAQQTRRHRDPAFQQFVEKLSVTDALNLYAELVTKLPALYAERAKATPQLLWEYGIEEFDRALASPAFKRAYLPEASPEKVSAFRAALRESWARRAVANPKDARQQLRHLTTTAAETLSLRIAAAVSVEFLCGTCAGLDDYTVYLTPSQTTTESLAGTVADLQLYGVYLSFNEGGLKVQGIVPNSWAAMHSPLVPGDRIIRVNGRLFAPGNPALLADALRNPTGGVHRLEIVAPVPDMLPTVDLPAAIPTVFGGTILSQKDGIGYLRLGAFRETTVRELDDAMESLKHQGMRALILDLRGNHGGLFGAGVQVTQRFLPAGIVVTSQAQIGEYAGRVFSSDSGMMAWDVPLVLLVDGETASSAEVLAGALKDNQRATLVGLPTFGKGSIQFPVKLAALDDVDAAGRMQSRSGSVRLTIARLISPRGTPITGQGVSPHFLEPDPLRQIEQALGRASDLLPGAPMPPLMPNP